MKHLLNTLYSSAPERYLSLDGENVVVSEQQQTIGRIPLHNLDSIVTMGYAGVSPALMAACVKRQIGLVFLNRYGRFLARVTGESSGNVYLRREQYRIADEEKRACSIAKHFIVGKLYNEKWVLNRTIRDHPDRIDKEAFAHSIAEIERHLDEVKAAKTPDYLRGLEGKAAVTYFSRLDDMILRNKENFFFHGRNRRPPMDNVNALLSFTYALLGGMCASALETVGLDSYVGFLHTDRPGRTSLAFDLMEELRAPFADRFVLTLINTGKLSGADFDRLDSGAVRLTDDGRRVFLEHWQKRKAEPLTHPFLKDKLEWGMVPYVQALLLARFIRGDLDGYPPFLWK